jgi:putative transposase
VSASAPPKAVLDTNGFFPVWIVGIVDYHGSRIVTFERVSWPTAANVARVLGTALRRHGEPRRILTDRAPYFTAEPVAALLATNGVRHVRIRPAHAWTNGRIERVFRIFREAVLSRFWLLANRRQIDRLCADFIQWHNRDRPHGSYDGRTPDEVHFGRRQQRVPLGRVTYFDERLNWYRFG